MANRINSKFVTVFTENGFHKVMLPSGEVLPHIVKSVTTDCVDFAEVEIKAVCNVVSTKEEALKIYEKS